MATRAEVLAEIEAYAYGVWDAEEAAHVAETVAFIKTQELAFMRDYAAGGHVGPSAVVVNADRTMLLMAHHTVLGRWSFFGNHCEGNMDMRAVALARVAKDAGAEVAGACVPVGGILDVDIHVVPAHERHGETVPEHLHYDVAYVFEAPVVAVKETARWVAVEEVARLPYVDAQMRRIMGKIMAE